MLARSKYLLVVITVVATTLLIVMVPKGARRQSAPPMDNGYTDFASVIPLVTANQASWATQDIAELRTVLQANSNVLSRVRVALKKPWQVHIPFDHNWAKNLPGMKIVAALFCAEGRLAELEHRTNDALRAFGDCILFGQKSAAGGLMIHDLVAIACKAMGMAGAKRDLPASSAAATRELLEKLSEADRVGESAEEFIARDKEWSSKTYGWGRMALQNFLQWKQVRKARDHFRARHLQSEADLRLLRVEAALRLYRGDKGEYPTALANLVPDYLEAVPVDPFNGRPMTYIPMTDSYRLHSSGPERTEHGWIPD